MKLTADSTGWNAAANSRRSLLPFRYMDLRHLNACFLLATAIPLALVGCVRDLTGDGPPGVCALHQIELEEVVVPMRYGLLREVGPEYLAAHQELFPNSKDSAPGGCDPTWQIVCKKARVYSCPECRAAELVWLENNDKYR